MPSQFERHGKSDDWDSLGSRHDNLVRAINDDPLVKSLPGKKDPGKCKGNHGNPHVPVIQFRYDNPQDRERYQCRYVVKWDTKEKKLVPNWHCNHQIACDRCGKIFDFFLVNDNCPVYPGDPEQLADVYSKIEERNEFRRTSPIWNRKRPVITGPQGYRKKRDD